MATLKIPSTARLRDGNFKLLLLLPQIFNKDGINTTGGGSAAKNHLAGVNMP